MEQKEKFLQYLQTCVKSTRATASNPLLLGDNASNSYASFLEPDKLFDYNPQKWVNINMYNIIDPEEAERVFTALISDDGFIERDKNDNQGWRRGAISHYVCFLNAERFFKNQGEENKSVKLESYSTQSTPNEIKRVFTLYLERTNQNMDNKEAYVEKIQNKLDPQLRKYDLCDTLYQYYHKNDVDEILNQLAAKDSHYRGYTSYSWNNYYDYATWTTVKQYRQFTEILDAAFSFISKDAGKHLSTRAHIASFEKVLQQIFYGAPGTGKSHAVCEVTKNLPKEDVFRITFHPDSDYASFVGCYKPTETEGFRYGINGANTVKMVDPDNGGAPLVEKKITYRFVPQAFINAYVRAYHTDSPVFLVIEEINRGNCAQIFGDMFQLLDRGDSGESDYAIKPDTDIQNYLSKVMADAHTDDEAIKRGEEMKLPANLYIWATMNTSDQSLFPIDSAFKRRWDWKYMPIDTTKEQWAIKVNGKDYSWGSFLDQVNDEIGETTSSEDKKLGFYFCKASGTTITAERFVSKVLFYIYNDVFKDYGLDSREFFKDKETGKVITFQSLFNMDGSVKEPQVEKILTNLGVVLLEGVVSKEAVSEELFHEEEPLLDEDGNEVGVNNSSRDNSRYSLNGDGKYKKGPLALAALEFFVQSHTDLSADEVYSEWKSLNLVMPSHFIENENEYNSRISASNDKSGNKRCNPVTCGDGHVLYISTQWNLDSISVFIERVNAKDWGIHIEKTND